MEGDAAAADHSPTGPLLDLATTVNSGVGAEFVKSVGPQPQIGGELLDGTGAVRGSALDDLRECEAHLVAHEQAVSALSGKLDFEISGHCPSGACHFPIRSAAVRLLGMRL